MNGYKISFYKYPRLSAKGQSDFVEELLNDSDQLLKSVDRDYITFGRFDRMTIERMSDCSRFRNLSKFAKKWKGDYLSLILYELDEKPMSTILKVTNDGYCNFETRSNGKPFNFVMCSLLSISDNLQAEDNRYREFLTEAKTILEKNIDGIIKRKKCEDAIKYQIFGSLGLSDLCILWVADQYEDVLSVIEKIQMLIVNTGDYKGNLIGDSISTISINRGSEIDHVNTGDADVKGEALVLISTKNGNDANKIKEVINDYKEKTGFSSETCLSGVQNTSGEYDVIIRTEAKNAIPLFLKGGPFHFNSDTHINNILQTQVVLCGNTDKDSSYNLDEEKNISEYEKVKHAIERKCNESKNLKDLLHDIEYEFSKLRKEAQTHLPLCSSFIDNIDAFYLDFRSIEYSDMNTERRMDFAWQFLSIIRLSCSKICGNQCDEKTAVVSECISQVTELFSCFINQIRYETELNIIALDTPICQAYYIGHQDLIYHGYYNFIKKLLAFAYKFKKDKKQPLICPMISIGTTSQIKSICYYQKNVEPRIVEYQLPTAVMLDLPFGLFSILHETFHYIEPFSRNQRNKLLITLVLSELFRRIYIETAIDIIVSEHMVSEEAIRIIFDGDSTTYKSRERISKIEKYLGDNLRKKLFEPQIFNQYLYNAICIVDDEYLEFDEENEQNEYSKYLEEAIYNYYLKNDFSEYFIRFVEPFNAELKDIFETSELFSGIDAALLGDLICNSYSKYKKPEEANYYFYYCYSRYREVYGAFAIPFIELRADIPMLIVSKMNLVDYLIFMVQNEKIMLMNPNTEWPLEHTLRMCLVVRHLAENCNNKTYGITENLQLIRESFIKRYIARFDDLNEEERDICRICEEAEKWIDSIIYRCNIFESKYSGYMIIFDGLVEHMARSTKNAIMQNYKECDIVLPTRKFFKENSEAENNYAEKILYDYNNKSLNYESIKQYNESLQSLRFKSYVDFLHMMKSCRTLLQISESFNGDLLIVGCLENSIIQSVKENLCVAKGKKQKIGNNNRTPVWLYRASEENVFSIIEKCSIELKATFRKQTGKRYGDRYLWYRGQSSYARDIIPNIARKCEKDRTILKRINDAYEEFKFRADGTPERSSNIYTETDYLALMQHFSLNTNFVDFSEDALSALYFALSHYIDEENEPERVIPAALYIFSPYLYNMAVTRMVNAVTYNNTDSYERAMRDVAKDVGSKSAIPNLSIPENAKLYSMYILGKGIKTPRRTLNEALFYPIAIHTSRLNERIKSQYGTFLAYNVFLPDRKGSYKEFGLEKIQEKYLNAFDDAKPFLYKIEINNSSVKPLAEILKTLGVSKCRIYPELENIGKKVKHVFD